MVKRLIFGLLSIILFPIWILVLCCIFIEMIIVSALYWIYTGKSYDDMVWDRYYGCITFSELAFRGWKKLWKL